MPQRVWIDVQQDVVALLDHAASVHEAEGRADLAQRHRRAAEGLLLTEPVG